MATNIIQRLRPAPTDAVTPLRLADDPQYAEAAARVGTFSERIDRLARAKLRIEFSAHFADKVPKPNDPHDAMLRARLDELRAEPPLRPMPTATTEAPTAAIARAMAVMAGDDYVPESPAEELERIEIETRLLSAAQRDAIEIRDRLAGELSYRACLALVEEWNSGQRELFEAGESMARAMLKIRNIENRIVSGGITFRGDILRMAPMQSALTIGRTDQPYSQISMWRQLLTEWGIL